MAWHDARACHACVRRQGAQPGVAIRCYAPCSATLFAVLGRGQVARHQRIATARKPEQAQQGEPGRTA